LGLRLAVFNVDTLSATAESTVILL